MSIWEAFILGIIQGITEFFPVSSSGHLALGEIFLGLHHFEEAITFNVVLHLGTLLAILLVYRKEITSLLLHKREKVLQVIIGTLPLFPLALLIKPIKELLTNPHILGFCFILTALLLFLGEKVSFPKKISSQKQNSWKHPLIIGFFQALALLPGVSRSGSTISAAKMIGWDREEAIKFSFMLAIPAIMGATLLELLTLFKGGGSEPGTSAIGISHYSTGFLSSFGIGYLSLQALHQIAVKGSLIIFAWYCLIVGILTSVYTCTFF